MIDGNDTHRKTMGYILLTGGFVGIGIIYDFWTLNDQITLINSADSSF